MKNLLLSIAAILLLSINLVAQDYSKPKRVIKKGQTDISLGYGLITTAVIMDKATTKLPPLSIRADHFMSEKFSLGAAFTSSSHKSPPSIIADGFERRITNTTHQLVLRPTFHVTGIKDADFYGGFQVGVNFESFGVDNGDTKDLEAHKNFKPNRIKGIYTGFVGGRYIINKKWSAFGEVGFSTSLFAFGVGYQI